MLNFLNTRLQEGIISVRGQAGNIMARYRPGDVIEGSELKERVKKKLADIYAAGTGIREREQFRDALFGMIGTPEFDEITCDFLKYELYTILEENGVVAITPDGVVLEKTIEPEELIFSRRVWEPDSVDLSMLQDLAISLDVHIRYSTQTYVIIDPRIYIDLEPEEISTFLVGLDVSRDGRHRLVHNMFLKKKAINTILQVLIESGRTSLADLDEKLGSWPPIDTEEMGQLSTSFTTEFLQVIIDDLRRMHLVEGNDQRIRLTSKVIQAGWL